MTPELLVIKNNWPRHIEVPVYGGRSERIEGRSTQSVYLVLRNHQKILRWERVGMIEIREGAPPGFRLLMGADGAQLLGADGAPLYGVDS